ncbi:hypothetical protein [Polyangium sorediatum]|uniref:Integral membrane protein n=1 Tax=Polyangium sorediatum TaxID=889274 RepID=A0ABT6NM53_9BACT|nr:hypothetical protein [Polyangium sorediatum]MDI1429396.1 hypothetical protein [Polyangium sorediatum]
MNLGDAAIVLRPRSLTEVMDLAFRLCFSLAFSLYARLTLVAIVPLLAGCLALRYALDASWLLVWLAAFLTVPFVEALFTVAVSQIIFSPSITPRTVFALFRKRLGALLGSFVLRIVGLVIGVVTFLLLLPFVGIRLLLLDEACMLEGLSGMRAYERAQRLVASRTGDAFLVLLMLLGARFGGVLTAELLFDGLVNDLLQFGRPLGWFFHDGGSLAALAGFFLAVPFVSTARFLYYIDTRTREDGWDIQLRFTAIRARAAQERRRAA